MADPARKAGDAIAELARDQIEREERSQESLERRGQGLVASSGVLVGLLFAFGQFGGVGVELSTVERVFLILSLLGFTAAAVLGLLCGWPRDHLEVDLNDLRSRTELPEWEADYSETARVLAQHRIDVAIDLRRNIKVKAGLLVVGLSVSLLGIVFLAVAIIVAIASD